MSRPIKAVVVTNVPSPYRVPVYQRVAEMPDIELHVVYCAPPHIDPTLGASAHRFPTHFLQGRYWAMEKRFMHVDHHVWSLLDRLRPDVVVTTGFIPTFLFAIAWALARGVPHVAMTDGTAQSERNLSFLHRWLRRRVYKHSAAFVGACEGALDLFRGYGVPEGRLHTARLCVGNDRFDQPRRADAADFIFCGRFVAHKRPLFALDVARRVAEKLGRKTSIDFVGMGVMEPELRANAEAMRDRVDVRMLGYVPQSELPARYAAARVFLFPTEWDPWGLVANEACAAGLPVIVSPHAGVAGELVRDGRNGYVRQLDVEAWGDAACGLLGDEALYRQFSRQGRALVGEYTFEHSAAGLADAIRQAAGSKPGARGAGVSVKSDETERSANSLVATEIRGSEGRVCIVQAVAKQYRKPFFDALYKRLQQEGVDLQVLYSDPNPTEALRKDSVDLPAAYGRKIPALWMLDQNALYQPALNIAKAADLVIVEQSSKHVLNYLLLVLHAAGKVRLAYWGHGRNWQESAETGSEKLKKRLLTAVDWWFAYTQRVQAYVIEQGFPAARVTVVQNSVDLAGFRTDLESWDRTRQSALRQQLGIGPGEPVGLFCGSMHTDKRLGFLLEAARHLRSRLPTFQLILVGAGPEEQIARDAAATHAWIHYSGPRFGADKAGYFAIADVFLCPGLVGLAVLESFAAGLPLFTTDIPIHSPEIDYLEDGVNGAITPHDPLRYAGAVADCLGNPDELARMRAHALASSRRYGMEAMIENFAQGVLSCLKRF